MSDGQTAPVSVRALLKCTALNQSEWDTEVVMEAQYYNTKEDNTFSEATPSGRMSLRVSNKDALPFFRVGQQYYIDMFVKSKPVPV